MRDSLRLAMRSPAGAKRYPITCYHRAVRFCPWYPLETAAAHAPAQPSVLQLRLAAGLREYPRGKSAMVHYQHAADAAAAAAELAERFRAHGLLCRHLEPEEERDGAPGVDQMAATCDKLAAEFLRRFGALPSPSEPDLPLPSPAMKPPHEAGRS